MVGRAALGALVALALVAHLGSGGRPAAAEDLPSLIEEISTPDGLESGAADLAIATAALPDPIVAGTSVTYTITVTNDGPDAAADVTVADSLPDSTTYISCAATADGVCDGLGNDRTVTFASLPAGATASITLVAWVNASVADGAEIANTATVRPTTAYDPSPANNAATAAATAVNRADVALGLAADRNPVRSGTDLTYTITAANAGPAAAQSVVVTDLLPAGTSFVAATASQGTCTLPPPGATGAAGARLTCNLGGLAQGASASVRLVVRVTARDGTALANTASVSAGTDDPGGANNLARLATNVGVTR
jgi:uncharacterized repeat protein (TIGR01451 family)